MPFRFEAKPLSHIPPLRLAVNCRFQTVLCNLLEVILFLNLARVESKLHHKRLRLRFSSTQHPQPCHANHCTDRARPRVADTFVPVNFTLAWLCKDFQLCVIVWNFLRSLLVRGSEGGIQDVPASALLGVDMEANCES